MKVITDVADVRGKYVLVRTSLNVPIQDGQVRDAFRLTQALPTLEYLRAAGARVIAVGHIGREVTDTLEPVYVELSKMIPIKWGGVVGSTACTAARQALQDGDIVLLENLRQDPREVANDPAFALELAALADVYVNDAFDNVHREHASMVGVTAHLPAYAGLTVAREVAELTKAMQPVSASLFIIGGAKFETKLPLIEKYLEHYDQVFVGGALLNDILLAQGYEIGQSLRSDVSLKDAPFLNHPKLLLAVDLVVSGPMGTRTVALGDVTAEEMILDIGPATVAMLAPYIADAKTILWNGPLGKYENNAQGSTPEVARLVAASEAFSVVGGGDTLAAIGDLGLEDSFGFLSTGGGAMLTLLEKGQTPALAALE